MKIIKHWSFLCEIWCGEVS